MTPEVLEIADSLMAALDCPRSLTVAILMRNGEWMQLAELSTNPHDFLDAECYLRAAQATDFLRKFPELPITIKRDEVALDAWWVAERMCFVTNRRLNELGDFGTLLGVPSPQPILSLLDKIRKIVWRIVGTRPPDELEARFGPGATISDRSTHSTVPDKITSTPTLTREAEPILVDWSSTSWSRAVRHLGRGLEYVKGNHFFTVPKDALKDRSCGKEPSLNVAFQLALGSALRRRLRRFGYDLDHLQDTHRAYAQKFSLDGSHATIDLSSASDCVSTSLVRLLLPPLWYAKLDSLRSPMTRVKGKWVKLEKFSSMGNGFTFELETVIFLAICLAICEDRDSGNEVVSVFGDDIIVPTRSSEDVITGLRFFGFKVNGRKTFTSGVFRESCGGDFFLGMGVRPYFLKDNLNEPQDFVALANGLRRMAMQFPQTLWPRIMRVWFRILDRIPNQIRSCRGPQELGDIVIHDDQERWSTRWRSSIRYLRCYRPATYSYVRWEGFAYEVQYAAALYGVILAGPLASKGHGSYLIPRDGVRGYKVGWTPFS
jgi:hypothetical protein